MTAEQLEERMDFILEQIRDEPIALQDQLQYAQLLALMEICRELHKIWEAI